MPPIDKHEKNINYPENNSLSHHPCMREIDRLYLINRMALPSTGHVPWSVDEAILVLERLPLKKLS